MPANRDRHERSQRRPSLARRLFVANAIIVVAAFTILALTPLAITSPLNSLSGGLLSLGGLGIVLATNLVITRRSLRPLDRLRTTMRDVDLLRPGTHVPVYGDSAEVADLTRAFNEMLRRLEGERRESVRRTLLAQEDERLQLARELHDEIGQGLTGLLLQLDYLAKAAGPELAPEAVEARESARATLEEVRRIARALRPEVLDDLGLTRAIMFLADRVAERSGLEIRRTVDAELPHLDPETELVIYRVAQESMTNVIRHADARHIDLRLHGMSGAVLLSIVDDGRGIDGTREHAGMKGMRERAVLVGGDLVVSSSPARGTSVRLEIPIDAGTGEPAS